MGGKVLRIAPEPPNGPAPDDWIALRVDDPSEIAKAVQLMESRSDLAGICLYPGRAGDPREHLEEVFTPVAAAGGVVLDEQGRLLAIRRLGKWDLPKGKVDPGEGLEEAALREVREECGLTELQLVRPLTITWHSYTHKGRRMLKRTDWFVMRASANEVLVPETGEDITEARWFNRGEADVLRADTYASLLPVLDAWALGEADTPKGHAITRPRP